MQEFELYHIQKDPWELDNLAEKPEYAAKVKEIHSQLEAEMKKLDDSFSTEDPKQKKREKKGKERKRRRDTTESKPQK